MYCQDTAPTSTPRVAALASRVSNAPRPRDSSTLKKRRTPLVHLKPVLSFLLVISLAFVNRFVLHPPQTTTTMSSTSEFPRIKEIRTFIIDGVGSGGDYHNVQGLQYLLMMA